MGLITKLTKAQEARFPEFVQKWTKIGLSTQPADRIRSERAISGLYELAKLKPPRVIWLPCPISGALAALVYTQVRGHLRGERSEPRVRSAVRSAVGSAVDSAVDSAVYSAAQETYRITDALRAAMREAGLAYFWAQFGAGYSAWADFFSEVMGVSVDRNYLDLTESCGFYWTLDDVCFAVERPIVINLDDRGRLHSAVGQSIGYRSGWGLWHWHGVQVKRELIENPETLTVRDIKDETNAEVRRVMIDRYGTARYLKDSGARIVQELPPDHPIKGLRTARLLSVSVPGDEPIVMIDLLNSTPEPDGTTKRYQLRVDPNAYGGKASRDCLAAAASTWRMPNGSLAFQKPEHYAPAFES